MYKRLTREEEYTYMSERLESLTNADFFDILCERGKRVYFIGVGGVSTCSLFCLSRHFGIAASGSDGKGSDLLAALIDSGEDVTVGERAALPPDTGLIVYSHAIAESHSERVLAREKGIPEISRAEYLGKLMRCYEFRVGVSGSHGKSTVTAMIAKIFSDVGREPTVLSGAQLCASRLPFSIGTLDYLIYEACEYKDSFLSFSPSVGVFLKLELDHTDYFKDIEAISESFLSAMKRCEMIVVNADDERLISLAKRSGIEFKSYGIASSASYRYEIISDKARNMRFRLYKGREAVGEGRLPMLGSFNISNAVAAISLSMECGIDFSEAAGSLSSFFGIGRRLEVIGEYSGRKIYYDYAHHPTEIRASIRAVRSAGEGEVTLVFRPHTYSRTAGLWDEFKSALSEADRAIILDVDPVREKESHGVKAERLASECGGVYCGDVSKILSLLDSSEGDIILMGAADLEAVRKLLTEKIK